MFLSLIEGLNIAGLLTIRNWRNKMLTSGLTISPEITGRRLEFSIVMHTVFQISSSLPYILASIIRSSMNLHQSDVYFNIVTIITSMQYQRGNRTASPKQIHS